MQTLQAGSFLNLENAASVEALKFTARRLAEMTTAVVTAENLSAEAIKNLANDLWQKAEYVARETERRRLHEIFNENFCERLRELKPEVSPDRDAGSEVSSAATTIVNDDPTKQSLAAPSVAESAAAESASSVSSPSEATEVEGKRDEFLGFVKTDEPFAATSVTKTEESEATEPHETEPRTIQATNPPSSEALKSENKTSAAGEANSENERVAAETSVSTEKPNAEKSLNAAPVAGNTSPAASANKNSANAVATDTKELFEFGKCTINLNLVLLPSSGDSNSRKLIVSAASHNLPPEIEFLEIGSSEDLTEIGELVRGKLARFKQTLPAKYIERLRTAKTKSAKKSTTAKTSANVAAPTRAETNQASVEKTSGEQKVQDSSGTVTEKSRTEITATKEKISAPPAPVAAVPQSVAVNNVQPSLF